MNTTAIPRETQVHLPGSDPLSYLNNSNNLDIYKMGKETGITYVMAPAQIACIITVDSIEIVTIQTRLLSYTIKLILPEAIIGSKNKTEVKTVMRSKQVHYNLRTRKGHEHLQN